MNQIDVFHNRLLRIGINTQFSANYPWIYLDCVNGKKVRGKYFGNHGFTAFFQQLDSSYKITDIKVVFAKIRKTLRKIEEDKRILKEFTNRLKTKVDDYREWTDSIETWEVTNFIDDTYNNFYK